MINSKDPANFDFKSELIALAKEQNLSENQIKGLLALHGIENRSGIATESAYYGYSRIYEKFHKTLKKFGKKEGWYDSKGRPFNPVTITYADGKLTVAKELDNWVKNHTTASSRGADGERLTNEEINTRQRGLFNTVYSDKYGRHLDNDDPNDGWRYRGRGGIQLTGKANYEKITKILNSRGIDVDLVANPELAADYKYTVPIAMAFAEKEGMFDPKSKKYLSENDYEKIAAGDPNAIDKLHNITNRNAPNDRLTIEVKKVFDPNGYNLDTDIDRTLDPTAQALGLPTSEDLKTQLQSYNDIKDYDEAVASGQADFTLVNPNYDPNRPQAEQYLDSHPELTEYFQGADNIPSVPSGGQPSADDDSRSMSDIIGLKMGAYEDLLAIDEQAALDPTSVRPIPNQNYDADRPLAEQYLEFNPDIRPLIERSADPSTPSSGDDPLNPPQSLIDKYGDNAYVFWKNMTPEMRADYKPTSDAGDSASTATGATGKSSGYEGMSAEELQGMYQSLLDADAAAAAGDGVYPLINQDFEPGPQAPQFLERRQAYLNEISDPDIPEEIEPDVADGFVGPPEMSVEPNNLDAKKRLALASAEIAKTAGFGDPAFEKKDAEDPERRKPNLGNMDYMGMLSSLGSYAARTGPLRRALKEAQEWDEVKYPRYNPALLDGTVPKRDVRDAYTTAMSTAGDQGKLDLGALALLATKQAQEVSRVEENLSNQNNQIKNQAQQLNNQITMQEMADTAANKGAAATMRNQIYADMSKMSQGSLREYNMMRNDANVKNMFENVFGDEFGGYLKDKYSQA